MLKMKVMVWVFLITAGFCLAGVSESSADLLFNRGLPTANLNNGAGALRSNVAWADTESSDTVWQWSLPGDNFVLSNPGTYQINDIRVWVVNAPGVNNPTALWGGLAGSTMSVISTSPTITGVTYSNGDGYQGGSGTFYSISQVDFSVNLTLTSGQYFDFFVQSPYVELQGDEFVNAFASASNAALSGSPQDGADNTVLWLNYDGSITPWDSNGSGWDKSSDINVQVFGDPTPEPATFFLFGGGLVGLLAYLRRAKKA